MSGKTILPVFIAAFALLAALTGCTTSKTTQTTSLLAASGFKIVPATTPDQRQQMKTLPAGKVSVVKRNGKVFYVYPDQAKNLLYVGKKAQYQAYRNTLENQRMAAADAKAAADSRAEALVNEQAEVISGYDTPGWGGVWGEWDVQ